MSVYTIRIYTGPVCRIRILWLRCVVCRLDGGMLHQALRLRRRAVAILYRLLIIIFDVFIPFYFSRALHTCIHTLCAQAS